MSDQAQRVTTEDNEDQEALAIVAGALRPILGSNAALYEIDKAEAQRILSALSGAGYTVVKTEWEYGYRISPGISYEVQNLAIAQLVKASRAERGQRVAVVRRRIAAPGPWEPVLEGGEQ